MVICIIGREIVSALRGEILGGAEKQQSEIAHMQDFVLRFRAKATKARQANSRAKRVEKIVIESLPQSSRRHPLFKLKGRRPSGRDVLTVSGIWKAFGDNSVLEEVSWWAGMRLDPKLITIGQMARHFHRLTGRMNQLYGLTNLDALSEKRLRVLPAKCRALHHVSRSLRWNNLNTMGRSGNADPTAG